MSIPFHPNFVDRVTNDSFLTNRLLDALETNAPVSFRKNPLKTSTEFETTEKTSWCEEGFYLESRPNYTLDPFFHAGCYYPQEAGSMSLDSALRSISLPNNPIILDLCASPGGKSTLISSFLNNKGMLVSNEIIHQRARVLKENMTKWGYSNGIVTNNEPKDFRQLPSFFDAIVVDAPCSGEGMFRKDPNARTEWSPENVEICTLRQRDIISDIWNSLKVGGFIVYSTCTFNASENEENIEWILSEFDATLVKIPVPTDFISGRNSVGMYGIPGKTKSEGFYIAVIQKNESTDNSKIKKASRTLELQKELFDIEEYANIKQFAIFHFNNQLLAIPSHLQTEFLTVQSHFHILKWGTNLGEIARKGIIPSHELAMNSELLTFKNNIELTKQQALKYLHGDTFQVNGRNGFQLMGYRNTQLGWCKNLGNRFNNLYPKEYRIRMNVR